MAISVLDSCISALLKGIGDTASLAGDSSEIKKCIVNPVYFIDTYCQTYDPRTPAKSMPFKLYPKQIEFVRWLQELEKNQSNGLCEKSRGVGVSFLCGAYALHGWLFKSGWKCGFGSRKLDYVDRIGDADSLFEKIRFMLRRLPEWMIPSGFKWGKHSSQAKLINPNNGAAITGEGGDEVGRGGRCSMYVVDEASRLEHPQLIEASLVETTNVRVDVSTPNGPGNPFAIKRFSGAIPVFTYHWRDDPRKNGEWAARVKKEKGPVVFAAEYDLDYSASIEGITIPGAWVRAAVELELLGYERYSNRLSSGNGDSSISMGMGSSSSNGSNGTSRGRYIAGLDIGEEGNDLSVFIPRRGPLVEMPIAWGKLLTTQTAWKARDIGRELGLREVYYDADGVGTGVKGTWNSSEVALPFRANSVHVGTTPTESIWPDGQTSKEKFLNLKAELWWRLRTRFERTYEYVTQGISHPPEDLISIPNCPQLIADLSLPLHNLTETGKIKIESKESLRKRGVKSPDYAEALVLSEAAYAIKKQQFWFR